VAAALAVKMSMQPIYTIQRIILGAIISSSCAFIFLISLKLFSSHDIHEANEISSEFIITTYGWYIFAISFIPSLFAEFLQKKLKNYWFYTIGAITGYSFPVGIMSGFSCTPFTIAGGLIGFFTAWLLRKHYFVFTANKVINYAPSAPDAATQRRL